MTRPWNETGIWGSQPPLRECDGCNGTGIRERSVFGRHAPEPGTIEVPCPDCGGSGYVVGRAA